MKKRYEYSIVGVNEKNLESLLYIFRRLGVEWVTGDIPNKENSCYEYNRENTIYQIEKKDDKLILTYDSMIDLILTPCKRESITNAYTVNEFIKSMGIYYYSIFGEFLSFSVTKIQFTGDDMDIEYKNSGILFDTEEQAQRMADKINLAIKKFIEDENPHK